MYHLEGEDKISGGYFDMVGLSYEYAWMRATVTTLATPSGRIGKTRVQFLTDHHDQPIASRNAAVAWDFTDHGGTLANERNVLYADGHVDDVFMPRSSLQ